jgi:hypothetical protein
MLKKLGLLTTPEDAFAEGFLLGGLLGVSMVVAMIYIVVIPIIANCVYWPKPLLPFGG